MLPRLSVKRPFTVIVMVILILIIGAVAYLNMGIDLLPEIELPYVVVMTTYPGASPEKVEANVTKPLEGAMASVAGVESIQSISSENVSMIIIQFTQSMNMDSAMIELNSYVDAVSSSFEEQISAPTMLRINPSMMPVMVMTADKDGMSEAQFSAFVEETLTPALERIEGVASVTPMGLVTEQIDIVWDDQAIEELNDRILAAIDSDLAEAEAELDDARSELNKAEQELDEQSEEAYQELAEAMGQLSDGRLQLALGQNALDAAPEQMDAAREELEQARTGLEAALEMMDGLEQIEDGIEQVDDGLAQLDEAEKELVLAFGSLPAAERALNEANNTLRGSINELNGAGEALGGALAALSAADPSDPAFPLAIEGLRGAALAAAAAQGGAMEDLAALAELSGAMGSMGGGNAGGGAGFDPAALAQLGQAIAGAAAILSDPTASPEQIIAAAQTLYGTNTALLEVMNGVAAGLNEAADGVTQLQEGRVQAEAARTELLLQRTKIEMMLMQLGGMDRDEIEDALEQIDEGLEELDDAEQELIEQQFELDDAKEEIEQGQEDLEVGRMTLSVELSSAAAQIALGQTQLDAAFEQFDEAREQAFKNAGLDGVLTPAMLSGILSASNFSMPAGYLEADGDDLLVKVGDEFGSLDELKNLLLMDIAAADIGPVYVRDIAQISVSDNSGEFYARINGNPGVILSLAKQSMHATADVSASINEVMEQLMAADDGLHLTPLSDQGYYIRMAVDAVLDNLLLGAALAIVILLLFLRSIRPTFIIAVSIPISLLFALGLMYFSGVNINVISLAGLATGVGMLVDNSIVVIENIYRLRREGVAAHEAAVEGARQISGAIAASTLTTICVFLPVVFTEGLARQLFVDMGLTVAYSLLASLLVSLTMVPTLASTMLSERSKKRLSGAEQHSGLYERFLTQYEKVLDFVLRRKWAIFVPVIAVAAIVATGVYSLGTGFIPAVDYGELMVEVRAPEDSQISDEEIRDISDRLTKRIVAIEGVKAVGAFEGSLLSLGGGSDEYLISMYVLCDYEQLSGREAEVLLKELIAEFPAQISVSSASFDLSALAGSGLQVVLYGEDGDTLAELARQTAALLAETEGLTEIDDGLSAAQPELRITVDKNAALKYGLTVAQIFTELSAKLSGETKALTVTLDGQDYPVLISPDPDSALDRASLMKHSFEVTTTNADGEAEEQTIYLRDIADLSEGSSLASIVRVDQKRTHSVSAQVDSDSNIGLAADRAELALAQLQLPEGYRWELTGESQTIDETMEDLLLMLLLAVSFIYLIMVAQFQSLLLPFIVLMTIPLSFTGGLLALIIGGFEISVVAMLGFLILAGVIVNNGIVLVDCVNQLRREQGMEKRAALLQAGKLRLRPILMTALTTVFALTAMAFSQQMGAELLRPLAVTAIGGLVYATALTLLFVPALYDALQRRPLRGTEVESYE